MISLKDKVILDALFQNWKQEFMQLKTLEEHVNATEEMARMAFYYTARWMKKVYAPQKSPGESLSCHTPLFFHGLGFPVKDEWNKIGICRRILDAAEQFADLAPEEFEAAMWEATGKDIGARAAEIYPRSRGMITPAGWNCGSLKYDPPTPDKPKQISLHIYNTVSPHSFFEYPDYLISCFLLVMREAELRYGADTLFCSSWLNDHLRWLEYFPAEWQENLSPRNFDRLTGMTVGDWGAIYDARGCLKAKYVAMVRESGKLPFCPRRSHCSFEAMRAHLAELAKEEGAK